MSSLISVLLALFGKETKAPPSAFDDVLASPWDHLGRKMPAIGSVTPRAPRRGEAFVPPAVSERAADLARRYREELFDVFVADERLPGGDIVAEIHLTPAQGEHHTIVMWQGHSAHELVSHARIAVMSYDISEPVVLKVHSDGTTRRPDGSVWSWISDRGAAKPGSIGRRFDKALKTATRSDWSGVGTGRLVTADRFARR